MSVEADLISKSIEFVKESLKHNDASHDWFHVERVWKNALKIAQGEGVKDVELVQLAAIMHDVDDPKYSGRFAIKIRKLQ